MTSNDLPETGKKLRLLKFPLLFSTSFMLIYGFNIAVIGLTSKGGYYIAYLDNHLNYINLWRSFTITTTSKILQMLGYETLKSITQLQVLPHGGFNLIYSCLGYGIMSLFTAFVISYQRVCFREKIRFLFIGLIEIQSLNILRFVALSIFAEGPQHRWLDHHLLFNSCLYGILFLKLYFWTNKQTHNLTPNSIQQ